MTISFMVPGLCKPAGSKRAFLNKRSPHKPIVTDDCKEGAGWKQTVSMYAVQAYRDPPMTVPIRLSLTFFVLRPQNHFGTGRNSGKLKESAPKWPCVKPDVTKLIRAVEDACTGIIWRDDNQVVEQHAFKKFGDKPGVMVTVQALDLAQTMVGGETKAA